MQTANRCRHDVVIVGARVAGSATAMLLARLGHDVAVVDQASFPSDTVSTHSISRSGVVQLRRWGLLDEVLDSGAPAIRQVTFHAGGESMSRVIKEKSGVDLVVAPRRYVLDTILVAAAERAGAEVRAGVTVTGVRRDGIGRVVGVSGHDRAGAPVELDARWVVGADGLRSRVASSVGAPFTEVHPANGAAQYAYYEGIPWNGFEFFVAPRSFAGVFPTHHGQACIFVCTPAADARAVRRRTGSRVEAFSELLERSAPQLAERLRDARRTRRSRACFASPTSCARRSGRAGRWPGTRAITVTRSPPTASATRSATPSCWPWPWTRRSPGRRGGGRRASGLPAATRPGAAGDLRDHLPPVGVPAGVRVRRAAEATGRRHRQGGGGAGRPAGPGRAPTGDCLIDQGGREEDIPASAQVEGDWACQVAQPPTG
jgi:2-polyprenyl-6-methoxyphenol hydroxylase-like FAD-dependent oxidoreductase